MLLPRTIAFAGDSARPVREDSPNDPIEIGEKCALRARTKGLGEAMTFAACGRVLVKLKRVGVWRCGFLAWCNSLRCVR